MDIDEEWAPTETDVNEYAEYIGIDPAREPELMWIAREGIKAPLPPNWIAKEDDNGDVFYVNKATGQQAFDHPLDEEFEKKVVEERKKLKKKPQDDFAIKPASLSSSKVEASLGQSADLNPMQVDEAYVPSEEEIREYAQYIGINPITEPDLLYIAEEGLKAPVPAGYMSRMTPEGEIEYINMKTQEVTYDHPLDDDFRRKVVEQRNLKQKKAMTSVEPAGEVDSVTFASVPASIPQAGENTQEQAGEAVVTSSALESAAKDLSPAKLVALTEAKSSSSDSSEAKKRAELQEIPPFRERARAPSPTSQLRFREEPEVQLSNMTQLQSISSNLENDFANEILRVTSEHAEEIKRILRAESVEISQLNKEHQQKLSELQKSNMAEIAQLRAAHDAEMDALKRQQLSEWREAQKVQNAQNTQEMQECAVPRETASAELQQCKKRIYELTELNERLSAQQALGEEQSSPHAPLDNSQIQYLDIFSPEANVLIYALPGPLKLAFLHQKYIIYQILQFLTAQKPKIDLQIKALEAKRASFTAEIGLLNQNFDKEQEKVLYKQRKLLDAESAEVSARITDFKHAQRFIRGRKLLLQHVFDSLNILPAYPQIYSMCSQFAASTTECQALFDFAVERGGWIMPPLQGLDESLRMQPQLEDLQRAVASQFSTEEKALLDSLARVFESVMTPGLNESGIYETIENLSQMRIRVHGNSLLREEEIPPQIVEFGVKLGIFERWAGFGQNAAPVTQQEREDTWMDAFRKELM